MYFENEGLCGGATMSKSLCTSTGPAYQEGLQDHSLAGDVSKRFHLVYPQSRSDLNCAAEDSSRSNKPLPESTVTLSQYNCHHRGGAYSCSPHGSRVRHEQHAPMGVFHWRKITRSATLKHVEKHSTVWRH